MAIHNDSLKEFVDIHPCEALRPYINCYWAIQSQAGQKLADISFPDACQEIIFNVNSLVKRTNVDGKTSSVPDIEFIGQMTEPYEVETNGDNLYFGIKFFPHSFSAFFSDCIYDLRNSSIDARMLFRTDIEGLISGCESIDDFNLFVKQCNQFFQNLILERHVDSKQYALVNRVVSTLYCHQGNEKITLLCKELGVSERSLQSLFKRLVGLSPKVLSNTIRFQSSFLFLNSNAYSLTDIAEYCGYFDQAHFVHSFKKFTGLTPSQYNKNQFPLNAFFMNKQSLAYQCNFNE